MKIVRKMTPNSLHSDARFFKAVFSATTKANVRDLNCSQQLNRMLELHKNLSPVLVIKEMIAEPRFELTRRHLTYMTSPLCYIALEKYPTINICYLRGKIFSNCSTNKNRHMIFL